jgi:hypothetical protein
MMNNTWKLSSQPEYMKNKAWTDKAVLTILKLKVEVNKGKRALHHGEQLT